MILSKIFGTKSEREIKKLSTEVDKINQSYDLFSNKSEKDLIVKTNELRNYVVSTRRETEESVKNIPDNDSYSYDVESAVEAFCQEVVTDPSFFQYIKYYIF